MSRLHDQIMNIVCRIRRDEQTSADAVLAYREGHRDARHAAAELALAQDARIRQLEGVLAVLLTQFPTDYELAAAGWGTTEIKGACDAYDKARAALKEPS